MRTQSAACACECRCRVPFFSPHGALGATRDEGRKADVFQLAGTVRRIGAVQDAGSGHALKCDIRVHVRRRSWRQRYGAHEFSRIDSFGVSHPAMQLVDGATHGSTPQDLVISNGSQICGTTLEFVATQFTDGGADIDIFGTAVIMAPQGTTVSVN